MRASSVCVQVFQVEAGIEYELYTNMSYMYKQTNKHIYIYTHTRHTYIHTHTYLYIYIYIYKYTYTYIYITRERERERGGGERERERHKLMSAVIQSCSICYMVLYDIVRHIPNADWCVYMLWQIILSLYTYRINSVIV